MRITDGNDEAEAEPKDHSEQDAHEATVRPSSNRALMRNRSRGAESRRLAPHSADVLTNQHGAELLEPAFWENVTSLAQCSYR